MASSRACTDSNCPNKGFLAVDANAVFYLMEGAIGYVQNRYPDLPTKARRVPRIEQTLDTILATIEHCCSVDGALYISDSVFYDEVMTADEKQLTELQKYNTGQRKRMLQVVARHFPQPMVVGPKETEALRSFFNDPKIRPNDRDASLVVVACRLAANEKPVVLLTSDPDFAIPLGVLIRCGSVALGPAGLFPTRRIVCRDYFNFVRCLHDCCRLSSELYRNLGNAYLSAQVERWEGLTDQEVRRRFVRQFRPMLNIHTITMQDKCATA